MDIIKANENAQFTETRIAMVLVVVLGTLVLFPAPQSKTAVCAFEITYKILPFTLENS